VNPGQVFGVLCCLGTLAAGVVAFEVGVFRLACALCRVPMPPHGRTLGLVLTLLVVPAVVDAIFSGLLYEVYTAMRAPLWEAGIVQFFLALPAHMAICSLLHARFMRLPLADGLAVWLVEKLLKLGLVLVALTVVGGVVLVSKLAG
jgi:undecaprenyl pyrophosphate phosphatase UppP